VQARRPGQQETEQRGKILYFQQLHRTAAVVVEQQQQMVLMVVVAAVGHSLDTAGEPQPQIRAKMVAMVEAHRRKEVVAAVAAHLLLV
jgi:hypothetical protein